MNVAFIQLLAFLGLLYKITGTEVLCLTSKHSKIQNLYITKCKFEAIFLEDLKFQDEKLDGNILDVVASLQTFSDFKKFEIDGVPFGKMGLSTYSRNRASGLIEVGDERAKKELQDSIIFSLKVFQASEKIYQSYNVNMTFFVELFMGYYGPFYYAALKRKLNIIRFCGTVRDNAIVVQHMTEESDRTHFSSLSEKSLGNLRQMKLTPEIKNELERNFADRYGQRWGLSSRNQENTEIVSKEQIRNSFGIVKDKKVGIIYSHILYDTLYFNGEYLFENYASWLVETVKIAVENPNIEWFIKIHPSNNWRGEHEYYHKGRYEEIRLIDEHIGQLPHHIRFIYPDTPFSPYSWLQVADFGVTITGTSGIELGALGKHVIVGGTGRYETVGFTINSSTAKEYKKILLKSHQLSKPSEKQKRIAQKFAHATFCRKPFSLDFFIAKPRIGKKKIFGVDDLAYSYALGKSDRLPLNLIDFLNWSLDNSDIDFLT